MTVSAAAPAGQLTWDAWAELRSAPVVHVTAGARRHRDALLGAGVRLGEHDPGETSAAGVVWLVAEGEAEDLGARLRASGAPVRVLAGAVEPTGSALLALVATMDRLRSPGGCPWDAGQTHQSLTQYLVEETYEVLEAIEDGEGAALREELGDLLLQVVFHARLAEEEQPAFGIDDVARAITDKLVRRHPHVFAGVESDAHTERGWDALKRAEKGRTSALDGVPMAQPALSLAGKLLGRVERAGLQPPLPEPHAPPTGQVGEEPADRAERAGDELLATVAALHGRGIDAEAALRGAIRRFVARVRELEATAPG